MSTESALSLCKWGCVVLINKNRSHIQYMAYSYNSQSTYLVTCVSQVSLLSKMSTFTVQYLDWMLVLHYPSWCWFYHCFCYSVWLWATLDRVPLWVILRLSLVGFLSPLRWRASQRTLCWARPVSGEVFSFRGFQEQERERGSGYSEFIRPVDGARHAHQSCSWAD